MSEANFIQEIKFNENFPPFKGGDKIFLGGEKEVQNLIEFYLKGKENKFLNKEFEKKWKKFKNKKKYNKKSLFNIYYFVQSKKNAKRFKINCVLGNNGGGKSTLLRGINDKLNDKDIKQITIDNNNKYSFYDNISIFDYTKVNINNKSKTKITEKSKNNEEIINFMEFTNSTYNISILGRFLKYVCIYSYVLNKYEYKKDFLEDFLGFSLKEKNIWKFGYGDENYNLFEIIEEYFRENNEKYLNDFINNKIEYTSKDNKKISFGDEIKKIINLSSGQKVILLRFSFYLTYILFSYEEFKDKSKKEPFEIVILIDEPDLHLHLDWQKQYIQKLIDVFSTLDKNIKLHFIIATHSPFIISDLPTESIVVLDGNGKEEEIEIEENGKKKKVKQKFTKIRTYDGLDFNDGKYLDGSNGEKIKEFKDYENYFKSDKFKNKKTFGANFVDIIKDGFFFEDKVLMGSFAENVIGKIAKLERGKIRIQSDLFDLDNKEKLTEDEKKIKNNLKNKLENIEKELKNNIQENIGDDFLRDNLLYFKGKNNAKY